MNETDDLFKRIVLIFSAFILAAACVVDYNVEVTAYSTNAASEDISELENEMALKINEARIELGLKPLYIVPYLNDVASTRSRELINNFDHSRPDGSLWASIIDRSLAPWSSADEILARGSANVEFVFNAWKGSESHWEAITNVNATHFGVGLSYEPNSERKWYWSAVLLNIEDGIVLDGQEIPVRYSVEPKATGDLTGDGQIDSFDLVLMKKYVDGSVELNALQIEAADTFKDGEINIDDILILSNYILGECEKLPVTNDTAI